MTDDWQPIEAAPTFTPVIVRTAGGAEFAASLSYKCQDGDGHDTVTWEEIEEGAAPSCWSGGVCWTTNEDGDRSDPPTHWRPLHDRPKDTAHD